MTNQIDSFRGEHEYLSCAYPCNIEFEGEIYPSVEHAFQAAKTSDVNARSSIRGAATSADAKGLGRKLVIDPNWDSKRLDVMADLVKQKFTNNLDLKVKLLMTGTKDLVQGGMYKDKFWGIDKHGVGENHVGKILMKVRDSIRASEGGPETVFASYLSKNGLGFFADSLKNLREQARKLVDSQKSTGQISSELSSLEEAVLTLE
ncbi:MAG TPA: NADAR family protein [Anaerovoracaceae bacterium]|nr:NADAR family protein [Anaerovoracaceae bacterium]